MSKQPSRTTPAGLFAYKIRLWKTSQLRFDPATLLAISCLFQIDFPCWLLSTTFALAAAAVYTALWSWCRSRCSGSIDFSVSQHSKMNSFLVHSVTFSDSIFLSRYDSIYSISMSAQYRFIHQGNWAVKMYRLRIFPFDCCISSTAARAESRSRGGTVVVVACATILWRGKLYTEYKGCCI